MESSLSFSTLNSEFMSESESSSLRWDSEAIDSCKHVLPSSGLHPALENCYRFVQHLKGDAAEKFDLAYHGAVFADFQESVGAEWLKAAAFYNNFGIYSNYKKNQHALQLQ
ncbi:hypothetical protein CCR75_000068 [Bremia lactucae]|uniref:Uncharacterized protein n=1 Tax=Bremia lactucae TaxID=4779 RepID=A0A976FI83_BRELC|nr:hypothetical protein CCR75_000068 [Bremia lactucae]